MKKGSIQLAVALTIAILSTGFAFQNVEQDDHNLKVEPLKIKDDPFPAKFEEELNSARKLLAEKISKSDSLLNERDKNLANLQYNLNQFKEANETQKKIINRLVYILKRFPQDSVLKYDVQYQDPATLQDTLKKNFNLPMIHAPLPEKQSFWQKINPFNKK
ncbi:hypothetical protein FEM33_01610 [Dyadobacter flavalbus]|uniref:OmpH family outer membrane protein n=1 Tax=Dyadobacter flavalbus TaxID=2579942 RepID=A0A5M8QZ03_9BACT|nr:hypothetical protein [Dyadobacter flavalbus]KAA6441457.1 hypothetical protein FEM33_01610 [Dyadobacter flavalbus]